VKGMKLRFRLSILFLLLIVCGPCVGNAQHTDAVCTVGPVSITQADITYQQRVDSCYYGRSQTWEQAVAELVSATFERAVLQSAFHLTPPLEALREKAAWIDSNTHDPKKLHAIQEVFGNDTSSYYSLVVSPTLVNARLHSAFSADTTIQRAERDSIEKIWAIVSKDHAQLYQFTLDTLVNRKIAKPNKTLATMGASRQELDPLVDVVLKHLAAGEVWNNIIEDEHSYKILQLLSQNDSEYYSLAVIVEKRPFDPWYRQYIQQNIPITFADNSLQARLRKAYPTLWWLRK